MAKQKNTFVKICFILLFIVLLPILCIYAIVKGIVSYRKKRAWEKEGKRGRELLLSSTITEVDIMEGYVFEEYIRTLFFYQGYQATVTTKSKDYGADIVLHKDGITSIVQTKRYKGNVGSKSVAEIVGAMPHYKAQEAIVVTNTHFTPQAETLAREHGVRLIDREELIEWANTTKTEILGNKAVLDQSESYVSTTFDEKYKYRI